MGEISSTKDLFFFPLKTMKYSVDPAKDVVVPVEDTNRKNKQCLNRINKIEYL